MLFVRSSVFCLLFVWLAMPANGQRTRWSPANYSTAQHPGLSQPTQTNWLAQLPATPDRQANIGSREPDSKSPDSWGAAMGGGFPMSANSRPSSVRREFNGGLLDSDPMPTPSVPDLKTRRSFSKSGVVDPAGRFSQTRYSVSANGTPVDRVVTRQVVGEQRVRSRFPLGEPGNTNTIREIDFQKIESPNDSGFKNVEDWYAPPSNRGAVNNTLDPQRVEIPQPQKPNSQGGIGWGPMNPTPGQQLFDPQPSDLRSNLGHR